MAKKSNKEVIELLDAEEFDYLKALELYYKLPVKNGYTVFPRNPRPNDIERLKATLQDFRVYEVNQSSGSKSSLELTYQEAKAQAKELKIAVAKTDKLPDIIAKLKAHKDANS